MKIFQIITFIGCIFLNYSITAQNDSSFVSETMKRKIINDLGPQIYYFKGTLCPEIDRNKIWPENKLIGENPKDLLYPGLDTITEDFFRYNFRIEPWPDNGFHHYINFFLVTKTSNVMTRERMSIYYEGPEKYIRANLDENGKPIMITDSFRSDIPCYKYFPYDERFLVYYDTIKRDFLYFSGNVYQSKLAYKYKYKSDYDDYMAVKTTLFRMAQYCTPDTRLEYGTDTEEYYEMIAKNTLLPAEKVIVRIPKTKYEWNFGDTWEIIYYSNLKDIPGNEEQWWYEVKYVRSIKPENYHELFPVYTKLTKEQAGRVLAKFSHFIDFEPYPVEEEEEKIDE